jgi:8-oxo-dGTP pyrophosphatase MutT (NUDIX family)
LIEQAGCVPYRPAGDGYEILLITTRKGKWALPKGIIDPGESPQETAEKEAFEEAGVIGEVEEGLVDTFEYRKWSEDLTVQVFLMRVDHTVDAFDDAHFRERAWLSPEEARQFIRKRNRRVLERAIELLDERFGRA